MRNSGRWGILGKVNEFAVLELEAVIPVLNVILRSTAVVEVLILVDPRVIVVGEI